MAARIVIGVASEQRLESFLQLTGTYYQGKTINEASVVRWRHLEGPSGPSATVELVAGDEPVGRMWIRTHSWSVRGQAVLAANPVDFLIREDYRGLPAFMSLFNAVMKESQQRSDLVYHTSNPLTDDLYRKLMKLKPVTELDGAVLPVVPFGAARAAGVFDAGVLGRGADWAFSRLIDLAGWLSRLGGVRLGEPPAQADQDSVLAAFVAEEPVCCNRSAAYRGWRFQGAGSVHYQERWVSRRGKALGYLVTSDRNVNGVRGSFVVDIVLPGAPSRLLCWSIWLQAAALAARGGRHALFFLHNRSNPRLAKLGSWPMLPIPRSRLPQQMPVFVRLPRNPGPFKFDGVEFGSGYYLLSDFDMF